jgi:hypothetical protein
MDEPADTPSGDPADRSLGDASDVPALPAGEPEPPLPVLAEARPIERPAPVSLPAAVAAATGGFLLGVAAFVLVRVLRRPRPARLKLGRGISRRGQRVDVTATRSFLVDVHLLRDR